MATFRAGDAELNITPAVGPWTGTRPVQEVTSFGSVTSELRMGLSGASIQMVLLGHAPEVKFIDELVTDLWLLGDYPKRYRLWAVWQEFDKQGDDRVSIQGVTYERLMSRRLFGAGGLLRTSVDVGSIVWAAVQHTQAKPGGNLGLTAGSITTGTLASVDWMPGENIGQKIEELLDANDCYWEVDVNKQVNVFKRRSSPVLDQPIIWGVNAESMQRASGGATFGQSVYASGSTETTPVFVTDPGIATDPRGLWEVAIARPTETIQSELTEAAAGELRLRMQALSHWNVDYVPAHWIGASRIKPGDRANLKVPRTLAGPIAPPPSVEVECTSLSLSFDGNGALGVRAVLGELPS